MFFNILSSLCIYNNSLQQSQNPPPPPMPQTVLQMKLVLLLIKIYKTIDVLYKTTLYVNLFPTPFFFLFWPGLKKCCYKYLQHLLLDEHSYKLKKGIL